MACVVGTMALGAVMARAQRTGPEFEVASVRYAGVRQAGVAPMGTVTGGPGTSDPIRIRYHSVPFVQLVEIAYGLNTEAGLINDGVVTPAQWMWDNLYEVVVNVAPGATSAQVRLMLQNLLAERFGMAAHREVRKQGGYEVVIGKDGPKLAVNRNAKLTRMPIVRDAAPGKDHFPEVAVGYAGMAVRMEGGRIYLTGVGQSVADLLGWSPFRLDHVIDKTGLEEKYDFRLMYSAASNLGPGLFDAMEKQLGLKVQFAWVSTDVVVIDKAKEMPTEN